MKGTALMRLLAWLPPFTALGLELLHEDAKGGRYFGRKLLNRYPSSNFNRLDWFVSAVADVRVTMQLQDAQVGVSEIRIYKRLYMLSPATTRLGRLLRQMGLCFTFRSRRGMVLEGKRGILFLTEQGLQKPRIVYEETAHSLLRPINPHQSHSYLDWSDRKYLEMMVRANPTLRVIYLPIRCHLDIFRGLLKSSQPPPRSTQDDKQKISNLAAALQNLCRCLRQPTGSQLQCSC